MRRDINGTPHTTFRFIRKGTLYRGVPLERNLGKGIVEIHRPIYRGFVPFLRGVDGTVLWIYLCWFSPSTTLATKIYNKNLTC